MRYIHTSGLPSRVWRYEHLPLAWNYNIHTSGLPAHVLEDWWYERLPLAWNYNIHTSELPAHVLEDWRYERLPLACQLLPAIHHRGREGARPGTAIRKPTYNESIISKREI